MSGSDVVIVGAGAAGSLLAHRLARAGRSVTVLEAGPGWRPRDLVSSQIYARRLKWGGAPVLQQADHRGFSYALNTGWGFGGAALHHYATWPRMDEGAFEAWPFGYEALRPHYDRVQAEVGVSGDAEAEVWRPPGDPYPLPPVAPTAQGLLLARGFEALGLPVAPLPLGILSNDYKGRPGCQHDGWCDAGCPIGALNNPLVTHLAWARAAGARIVADATVTRVLAASPERAAGVEWVGADGERRREEAAVVILAANAVMNPRILLASTGRAWPQGPGNREGLVGRGFMLDALALVFARFDEPTDPHLGVSAGTLMNRVRGPQDRPGAPPGRYWWQIGHAMKPNDIFGVAATRPEIRGAALHDFIRDATGHLAGMGAMMEQAPQPGNRIELAATRDAHGVPLARVVHRADAAVMALWNHCQEEGLRAARAGGAREAWGGPFNMGHPTGGTPMGEPGRSVCDAWGRVHGVRNLLVAGGGLFPGGAGISPTFTILALADRTATRLAAHWGDYA